MLQPYTVNGRHMERDHDRAQQFYLMLSVPFSLVCETDVDTMDKKTKMAFVAVVMMATGLGVRDAQHDLNAAFKAASNDFKMEEGL